jgi:hypothetical protein
VTIVSAHRRCWFKSEHVTSISIVSPSTRFATLSQTGLKGIDRVRTDNSVDPEVPLGDSVGNAVSDVVERWACDCGSSNGLFYSIDADVHRPYLACQFSGDPRLSNPWQPG